MSQFQETIERCLRETGAPSAQEATAKQLYHSVSRAAMAELMARWKKTGKPEARLLSFGGFLTGRLIYSNLMNLGTVGGNHPVSWSRTGFLRPYLNR